MDAARSASYNRTVLQMECAVLRAVGLCVLMLAACARPVSEGSRHKALSVDVASERVFRYAAIGGEHLDPARIADSSSHQLMLNVFEGLYTYALGDGEPVAAMATGCDVSADKLHVTCKLRPSLTWSDGTPLTAADFVYSWRRALNPKTASRSAQLLWFIAGAKAFNDGRTNDPSSVGARALDATTLQIELAAPTPFFKHLLAEMPYAPTPRHVIEKHGVHWTQPAHIVSNGPYLLAEHRPRSLVVLRKNPRYIDADKVFIERVQAHFTESEQTAFDWYEVGKIDWTGDPALPTDKLAVLARSKRADLHRDPYLCTYYYALRTDQPALSDVRIRQAINLAIDRDRLLLHILNSGAVAATGNVPNLFGETHGYHSESTRNFNPQRARALLAEAGYPRGIGLPTIELTFNTQEMHRVVAEFVQRSLHEQLGIKVTLANMEWKTLLKRLRAGDFSMSRSGWCADYPDPLTFLEVFHSQSAANYSGFNNAGYDELIAQIRGETDRDTRNKLFARAEDLLTKHRPIVPIFHYARAYLLRPWVQGFAPQMQDFHPFKYLRYPSATAWRKRRGELAGAAP